MTSPTPTAGLGFRQGGGVARNRDRGRAGLEIVWAHADRIVDVGRVVDDHAELSMLRIGLFCFLTLTEKVELWSSLTVQGSKPHRYDELPKL